MLSSPHQGNDNVKANPLKLCRLLHGFALATCADRERLSGVLVLVLLLAQ